MYIYIYTHTHIQYGWMKRGGKSFKIVVLWLSDMTKDPFNLLCHTQHQLHPLTGSNQSPIPEPHPHKTGSRRKRSNIWLFSGAEKHVLEPPFYRLPPMPITERERPGNPLNQTSPPGAKG